MVMSFRKVAAACAAGLALLIGGAGIAYAAIPDAGGVFHGCAGQVGGYLRVIDTGTCISTETAVSWKSGFSDWTVTSGTSPIPAGAPIIEVSCDYANGYRLLNAVAQQPSNGSPFQIGVSPIEYLTQVSGDVRPTGARYHVTPLATGDLSWQLSCAK